MRLAALWRGLSSPQAGSHAGCCPDLPVSALRSNGLRWLLVYERDHGANDFRYRPAQWGITLATEDSRYRVYGLD